MGRISIKVCDRCGKEMEYSGWTSRVINGVKRGKRVKIRKYFDGNPDGYSYSDWDYEMCNECTKKLEEFLRKREPF